MNVDSNVILVHETAYSPEPICARRPLEWYIGKSIKTGFQSHDDKVEYMWVKVTGIESPNLVGELDNIPLSCTHLKLGERVVVSRLHIVEVDLSKAEWWEEVAILRAESDYFNRHLGSPCQESGFGDFQEFHFTPRQALTRWQSWMPDEDEPLHFLSEIADSRGRTE